MDFSGFGGIEHKQYWMRRILGTACLELISESGSG